MNIDEIMQFGIPGDERVYAYWLHSVPWIGQGPVPALLKALGPPKEIYKESDENIIRAGGNSAGIRSLLEYRKNDEIFRKFDELTASGMKVSFAWEKEYPARLKYIPDPPLALFYIGRLPENNKFSVAVIGARQCSEYGSMLAENLGEALGKNDVNVISGMACGIDSISQEAAADAGGHSYAVLGCGADICYPDSVWGLYEKLKNTGGILSAYPPGTKALSRFFPPRNRIVSGLSDAVVVLEARQRSGTLITVDMALEQGRDVYAAPGRLTDELSAGCNGLIGHGARVYLSPEIFMRDLMEDNSHFLTDGFEDRFGSLASPMDTVLSASDKRHRKFEPGPEKEPDLDEAHLEIYRELSLFPQGAEEIDRKLKRKKKESPGETGICLILMELCLTDHAMQVSPGQFIKK